MIASFFNHDPSTAREGVAIGPLMNSAPPTKTKTRRWRRRFVMLAILLTVLAALTLSLRPAVPETPPPTAAQVRSAKKAFDRLRDVAESSKPGEIALSWSEASNAVTLAGQMSNVRHIALKGTSTKATLLASIPAGRMFWINVEGNVDPSLEGFPVSSAKIGRLPIPAFLTRATLDFGRAIMGWRGIDLPAFDAVVQSLTFTDAGLIARVTVPRNSELYATLNRAQSEPLDTKAVVAIYCRLARAQRASIATDLATQVRRAFTGQEHNVPQNRAAFVALAMFTVSPDVGNLAGDTTTQIKPCRIGPQGLKLLSRGDLAKHWTLSAALTAAYGPGVSQAMGSWKEVSDSGHGGTGFSFVDLSADRSGIRFGTRATDEETAASTAQHLQSVDAGELLPLKALALAEGMSEAEFSGKFATTQSKEYARMVARIDRVLAGQPGGS